MVSFGVRLLSGCLRLDRLKFLNRGSHGQDSVRGRQRSVGFEPRERPLESWRSPWMAARLDGPKHRVHLTEESSRCSCHPRPRKTGLATFSTASHLRPRFLPYHLKSAREKPTIVGSIMRLAALSFWRYLVSLYYWSSLRVGKSTPVLGCVPKTGAHSVLRLSRRCLSRSRLIRCWLSRRCLRRGRLNRCRLHRSWLGRRRQPSSVFIF